MTKSVESLIRRLESRAIFVATLQRWQAAQDLGDAGDIRAVEPLCRAAQDPSVDVRRTACAALGKIGDVRAVETLCAALKDSNCGVRAAAAEALGKLGDARAVDPLCGMVKDESVEVRRNVAVALGRFADPRAATPLCAALLDVNPLRLAPYLYRGARMDNPEASEVMTALLDARRCAVDALVAIGAAALEPLCIIVDDVRYEVRMDAASALARIGDVRAVEPLCRLLSDNVAHVRARAAAALVGMLDERAVEPLSRLIHGAPGPLDSLTESTLKAIYEATISAIDALAAIGDKGVWAICPALRDPNPDVRTHAADVLARVGRCAAIARRVLAARGVAPNQRLAALEALVEEARNPLSQRLDGTLPPLSELCRVLVGDEDEAVRAGAEAVLRMLEVRMLLVPAHPSAAADRSELLRAASGDQPDSAPDELLRPIGDELAAESEAHTPRAAERSAEAEEGQEQI